MLESKVWTRHSITPKCKKWTLKMLINWTNSKDNQTHRPKIPRSTQGWRPNNSLQRQIAISINTLRLLTNRTSRAISSSLKTSHPALMREKSLLSSRNNANSRCRETFRSFRGTEWAKLSWISIKGPILNQSISVQPQMTTEEFSRSLASTDTTMTSRWAYKISMWNSKRLKISQSRFHQPKKMQLQDWGFLDPK